MVAEHPRHRHRRAHPRTRIRGFGRRRRGRVRRVGSRKRRRCRLEPGLREVPPRGVVERREPRTLRPQWLHRGTRRIHPIPRRRPGNYRGRPAPQHAIPGQALVWRGVLSVRAPATAEGPAQGWASTCPMKPRPSRDSPVRYRPARRGAGPGPPPARGWLPWLYPGPGDGTGNPMSADDPDGPGRCPAAGRHVLASKVHDRVESLQLIGRRGVWPPPGGTRIPDPVVRAMSTGHRVQSLRDHASDHVRKDGPVEALMGGQAFTSHASTRSDAPAPHEIQEPCLPHQLRRDGQPKSGATEVAGSRAVGLRECLEDPLLVLCRYADAGI